MEEEETEFLCGNPEAVKSLSGETDCGFFGCGKEEALDFIGGLQKVLNYNNSAIKKLDNIKINEFTGYEEELIDNYELLVDKYETLKKNVLTVENLDYDVAVEEIKVVLNDSLCNLQELQSAILERGGTFTPTNLSGQAEAVIKSRRGSNPWILALFLGAGVLTSVWLLSKISGITRTEVGGWRALPQPNRSKSSTTSISKSKNYDWGRM